MVSLAAAAPVVGASFIASSVEIVEAFTIVLAVSVVRGPRPAIAGTAAALVLLAGVVAALGPLLAQVPVHGLQIVVGVLLLIFGLGWLRKAVLRAAGAIALHDAGRRRSPRSSGIAGARRGERGGAADWLAGVVAFKAVLSWGPKSCSSSWRSARGQELLLPAALGAALACVIVLALGVAIRAPLSRSSGEQHEVRGRRPAHRLWRLLVRRGPGRAVAGRGSGHPAPDRVLPVGRAGAGRRRPPPPGEDRVMAVLRELGATLVKMFVADFWLSFIALIAVGLSAAGLRGHWIAPDALPFLLGLAVLAALTVGVLRGAQR